MFLYGVKNKKTLLSNIYLKKRDWREIPFFIEFLVIYISIPLKVIEAFLNQCRVIYFYLDCIFGFCLKKNLF